MYLDSIRLKEEQSVVQYNDPVTISQFISNHDNDAEERKDTGAAVLSSNDLEMCYDPAVGQQLVGLRFESLSIPQGAKINSVSIQFETQSTDTGAVTLTIKGHDVDNSPIFDNTTNDVANRVLTTASVDWSPDDWTIADERGAKQQTPDLSEIVQEIVDRAGYTGSSAITFIIDGDGSTNKREAHSYSAPAKAAEITVEYQTIATSQDAIESHNPSLYLTPASIEPAVTTDGATITTWEDVSGNGLNATTGGGTMTLNIGTTRQVEFDGTSWMDVADDASLEFLGGTDEITVIFREGDVVATTSGYGVSKASSSASNRSYGVYYEFGDLDGAWAGSTNGNGFTSVPAGPNRLVIQVITTSSSKTYVDGVLVKDAAVGTGQALGQSVNIGSRSDGAFPMNAGSHIDLVAIIPKALNDTERQEVETEFMIN